MNIFAILLADGYKTSHHVMYPKGTKLVYSNFTPRNVKYMPEDAKDIVVMGIKFTVLYIKNAFQKDFFDLPKDVVIPQVKQYLSSYLGYEYNVDHFEKLHDLGYLPLHIKALPEGTIVKPQTAILTFKNTSPEFYWLVNFLETLISTTLWKIMHSASISYGLRKLLNHYALETDKSNMDFVAFQGHDFSMRGMQGDLSALASGLGFTVGFSGSDTLPVIQGADLYYDSKNVVFGVPASEHAVSSSYGIENEEEGLSRIIDLYPKGVVSLVSDTYDFWKVHTETIYHLKEQILARDGKVVFRGDSGDPADVVCGVAYEVSETLEEAIEDFRSDIYNNSSDYVKTDSYRDSDVRLVKIADSFFKLIAKIQVHQERGGYSDNSYFVMGRIEVNAKPYTPSASDLGQIELLWNCFGGTVNEQGFKVLNPKVGAIWGDGCTFERIEEICERLANKGYASTNIVFGIGSYTLGYATRDQQGTACKATYCEVFDIDEYNRRTKNGAMMMSSQEYDSLLDRREIYKDPITDKGKSSKKGLLRVDRDENGQIATYDQQTWEQESGGLLETVFLNGEIKVNPTINEIRERLFK